MVTRRVREYTAVGCARTEVSDIHSVASVAVDSLLIRRAMEVYPAAPNRDPCTVRLTDPVPGLFDRLTKLGLGTSKEKPSVADPNWAPAVNITRRVERASREADCVNIEESDAHAVPSATVAPVEDA